MKKGFKAYGLPVLCGFFLLNSCTLRNGAETSPKEFLVHTVEWLADPERNGRPAGTIHEADAANFIADQFLLFGLHPAGDEDTYLEHFLLAGPVSQAMGVENYISRNVAGVVKGTETPGQYIVIGAHYDGQGSGGIISMNHGGEPEIHYSADDNASGTAGLLYLAREFAEKPAKNSILFVAFSGEELGLLGSRHHVRNMAVEGDSVLAMINMDMIGRLNERRLTVFGTGTSPVWDEILDDIHHDSLQVTRTPSGSGASDHAAFYEARIPVLHYFTGTHGDYHRATDTAEKINYDGMLYVLGHVATTVRSLGRYHAGEIEFTESTDPSSRSMPEDGVTLGVIPDYSYSGEGFRIEGVRSGNPAEVAGMQGGDVITNMDGKTIKDIYDYMEALAGFKRGDEITVTVLRGDDTVDLKIIF